METPFLPETILTKPLRSSHVNNFFAFWNGLQGERHELNLNACFFQAKNYVYGV